MKIYISICTTYKIRQTFSFRNNLVHMLVHNLVLYCVIDSTELQADILFRGFFFSFLFGGGREAGAMICSLDDVKFIFWIFKIHSK